MFQHDRLSNEITLFQKIKNLDYILLISVILLSVLSVFVMYSTDGGEILFHTKNHFLKLAVFFPFLPAPHKTNVFNGLYESFKK